jgi:hypothetical protein
MARQYRHSPTKVGSSVREMVDTFAPPIGLLCKLGSIVVHVDEGCGEGGHAFDWSAVGSLIADREVQDWLASMDAKGFLPKRRS